MSEAVLVNFRLDKDRPLKFRWLAADGAPGDGYKAQIVAINLADGSRLAMDRTAIMEQTAPAGEAGTFTLTFTGMVGYAKDHKDRAIVDVLADQDVDYELEFVHDETGRVAVETTEFEILERPRARASKLPGK